MVTAVANVSPCGAVAIGITVIQQGAVAHVLDNGKRTIRDCAVNCLKIDGMRHRFGASSACCEQSVYYNRCMIQSLNVEDAKRMIEVGGVDVVDVRETWEWNTGHIPGARLVPLERLREDPAGALPRDNVVFVCAKGVRSLAAAKLAERMGLGQLYNLEGGTLSWARAGLPLAVGE